LANAVAHRSSELNTVAVRVEIHADRVTITSPGDLPEPVTLEHMRDQNSPRNITIIDSLRRFGLAEDAGLGVDLMQDRMEAHLLEPPEFSTPPSAVSVAFKLGSAVTPFERAWLNEVERRGEIRPKDATLLVHALREGALTNQDAREILAVDSVDARNALQRLRDAGFLSQAGTRGGTQYLLSGDLQPPGGLGLGADELRRLVLAMAEEGPVKNADLQQRLGLSRDEALAILRSLTESGEIVRSGERRGTRYQLPAANDTLDL
jgi:ATP-dependent DNA helicase RecG